MYFFGKFATDDFIKDTGKCFDHIEYAFVEKSGTYVDSQEIFHMATKYKLD